jgi:hypothetical protein
MRLGRHPARMVAMMIIVMIVAYLAPSIAEAHSGHHHLPPVTVSASEAIPASHAISAPSQATAMALEVLSQEGAAIFVSAVDFDGPSPFNRCTGPCCCNTSMSCGAHAFTANTGGVAPIGPATCLVAIPDDLVRPGIDPEALPKPPKTFA